ncbi:RNA pseudouridine synthase 6, chloroplastic isoform X2 [Elaeis guineensis]|uniref:RNA pseudouridine synthase 6, chloroplastic isoform X2 n=1 Tax=Elaeis guineensis var. tenera TaxID=51953 RepID=UPI003C6CC822
MQITCLPRASYVAVKIPWRGCPSLQGTASQEEDREKKGEMPTAIALASLSNALVSPLWASSRRALMAPAALACALAAAPHPCRNRGRKKDICWVATKKAPLRRSFKAEAIAVESTASALANGYPEYKRLLPCPSQNQPPRVEHLVVSEEGVVLDYISKALHLPPLCYEIDWKSRIIAVADSYVVLDKPAATSVGGTTDNIEECCATFASRALGLETPLKTTHQIDNCTEGCVVLARTKEFCSIFHGMIREKQVKKFYRALAAAPVPVGIISHYMRPVNVAPRLVSEESIGGGHLCQLEVLECKEVPWPNVDVEKSYGIEYCEWPSKDIAYECKINLLTGKTHQVRAQLAAIGAPIVGDSMYMPAAVAEMCNPQINPFGRNRKQFTSEDGRMLAIEEWIAQHGKEPSAAIGLQAFHVSWNGGNCSYEAGAPWWQCATS